jgi:signal transduction histidine kinase
VEAADVVAGSTELAVSGILTSRIGRRFVALFLGCAFLPLVVFAWMTLSRVTHQMNAEMRESLHNGAKTSGMGIAARLSQVGADLARIRERLHENGWAGEPRGLLAEHVAERCETMWIVDGDRVVPLRGDAHPPVPKLGAAEREHLASGKPLLRVLGSPAHLAMMLAIDKSHPDAALLVAGLRGERFWDAQELRSPGAEFAVLDDKGVPLRHSFRALPELVELVAAMREHPSSGMLDWTADGEPHVARYWRAFLRPQYDLDLVIVQSKSRNAAFEVADAFAQWFVLTALCTLLCVLFASLVQMRRTLGPIVSLGEATRRVAQGDLDVRVSIKSRDEFGALGKAFNHMTAQIQENVRRRAQTERELVASRDQALAAARAKAEFVTNVSHEFRTPMTEILGATEILAQVDDADGATRREFTAIAASGAKRLARMIDDVLELGATTALAREPIDIAASLMDAIGSLPSATMSRIRTDIADGLPPVVGEAARLRDVWCRLIDNAAKFSPPESPIEIRARHCGEIVVEFVDQGVGISRLDLARIFEPFSQVGRDQMTDKAQGTGLGLTLAKSAVERHGGHIEVDSELGNGAVFRVFLPAAAIAPVAV